MEIQVWLQFLVKSQKSPRVFCSVRRVVLPVRHDRFLLCVQLRKTFERSNAKGMDIGWNRCRGGPWPSRRHPCGKTGNTSANSMLVRIRQSFLPICPLHCRGGIPTWHTALLPCCIDRTLYPGSLSAARLCLAAFFAFLPAFLCNLSVSSHPARRKIYRRFTSFRLPVFRIHGKLLPTNEIYVKESDPLWFSSLSA